MYTRQAERGRILNESPYCPDDRATLYGGAHFQAVMARQRLCPTLDHPGVTYNPWLGKTWCLCGAVIRDGNHVAEPHVACCGGPLSGEAS